MKKAVLSSGVKSLFEAAKNAITGVEQGVSSKVLESRLELCNACPKLTITRQCSECLCFVDLKTKLRQESCPIGKWASSESGKE